MKQDQNSSDLLYDEDNPSLLDDRIKSHNFDPWKIPGNFYMAKKHYLATSFRKPCQPENRCPCCEKNSNKE